MNEQFTKEELGTIVSALMSVRENYKIINIPRYEEIGELIKKCNGVIAAQKSN